MESRAHTKILFVITKSVWGGAQRYVYDLATHLPKDQFEVLVAAGGSGDMVLRLRAAGVPVAELGGLTRDLSVVADFRGFISLYRTIRAARPDIVHLNSSKAGGLGALAARLLGVRRIVFTAHGWPFAEKRNVLWRVLALLGSWATALLSHAVIVVSKHDLSIGQRLPFCGGKMHLIYNGIDMHAPLASGELIRRAFPSGVHITGTIGELTHNKNQISLVKQARRDPQMYVAIVGEGEERARLEAAIAAYGIQDRVKLFGFLPASEVLRGFDTFALPSLKEGLPYVLLEAKAAGLPIDANCVGGVGEILDANEMKVFSLPQMLENTSRLYIHR